MAVRLWTTREADAAVRMEDGSMTVKPPPTARMQASRHTPGVGDAPALPQPSWRGAPPIHARGGDPTQPLLQSAVRDRKGEIPAVRFTGGA